MIELKKSTLLQRFNETDKKVESVKKKKEEEMREKFTKHLIKELDKEDNIKLMEAQRELYKEKLNQKIEKDNLKKQIIEYIK